MHERIVFAFCFLRGGVYNTQKNLFFISYVICRVADFEQYSWIKIIIFIE